MSLKKMRWLDEIKIAFEALGGAARYADLYEYIIRTTDRDLSPEWRATVRRTIEDHSSDSLNHRAADVFEKLGHGHWGLRGVDVSENELLRRDNLSPKDLVKEVFVREHWRSAPSSSIDPTELPHDERLSPASAWCTDTHLEVRLVSGTVLSSPIDWYPRLAGATPIQRSRLELSVSGVHWEEIDEDISVKNLLFGTRGIPPKSH